MCLCFIACCLYFIARCSGAAAAGSPGPAALPQQGLYRSRLSPPREGQPLCLTWAPHHFRVITMSRCCLALLCEVHFLFRVRVALGRGQENIAKQEPGCFWLLAGVAGKAAHQCGIRPCSTVLLFFLLTNKALYQTAAQIEDYG